MSTAFGIRESVSSPQVNARRPLQVNHEGGVAGAARPPRHRFARLIVRRVVIPLASLALVGCETQRMTSATDPAAPKDTPERTASAGELGATASTTRATGTTLGGPLAGLDAGQLARFEAGRAEFMEVDGVREGLGPVFNDASCVTCHNAPVGGTTGRVETRFGLLAGGQFDALERFGGSLLQDRAVGEVAAGAGTFTYVPEVVPIAANVRAGRVTTPLFGLGLVDAVPDRTFQLLARLEAFYSPATAGRPNVVSEIRTGVTRVGRFGWKAQEPTLHQFAGEALLNEMGVTNPEFPEENCPNGDCSKLAFNPVPAMNDDGTSVERSTDFMTLLGPPPRKGSSYLSVYGELVFASAGCANCHTPALVTGPNGNPALSNKVFFPYSDFLLHDMGALGDGIAQGRAGPNEMRTTPLWGLTAHSTFLHDGRAKSIDEAIRAHGGQGAISRSRYGRMDFFSRAALQAFLRSL